LNRRGAVRLVPHLLRTPLLKEKGVNQRNAHWQRCQNQGLPYATFRRGRKYGTYQCDLYPARLVLTEAGEAAVLGILEAFFARWRQQRLLSPRKARIIFTTGPVIVSVEPCPVGEEDILHEAIVRVLTRFTVPDHPLPLQSDAEQAQANPGGGILH